MAKDPFDPFAGVRPIAGEFDTGAFDYADPGDYADDSIADLKEAFGLPDSLPPVRLPSLPELAAQARKAPLTAQLAALAAWAGEDGQEVNGEGELTEAGRHEAMKAVGAGPEDFAYLWEYALAVEWLDYDADADDRVVSGEMAQAWADDDDAAALDVWSSTLAAVLGETLFVGGPAADADWDTLGVGGLDFDGQPLAMAILLFLARREGLTVADFTEVLWENACGELPAREAATARARWLASYADPARLLLDKLAALHAVTESGTGSGTESGTEPGTGDTVRLTPLALAALHEQLVDAGVDIPLLPPTAAELTGAQLLAMAEAVDDDEFEAETDAWVAARGADSAARELLGLAAAGDSADRMLAVAAVTRIGAAAEQAWRDSLDVPQVRAYAKAALAALSGDENVPPELEQLPADVAWMTTDLLALACDEEFPDPEEIVASFREAVPAGRETAVFEIMWRSSHPEVLDVLTHIGRYHPDKSVAKAARTAAHKAGGRRPANG